MQVIAGCIADILHQGEAAVADARAQVKKLTDAHPLY